MSIPRQSSRMNTRTLQMAARLIAASPLQKQASS
jgi:hypothetical protein